MTPVFQVDLVSAEEILFSGEASAVYVTTVLGEIGILKGHAPLLAILKPAPLRLVRAEQEDLFYISGGILEVQPKIVTILADTAARAADLDEVAALEARQSAEQHLAEQHAEFDYSKALSELAETAARLQAISRFRKKIGK